MIIEKRDRALLVKLFYLNGSKSSAGVREYHRIKGLRGGPMSTKGLKKMMKFENTGDFGVASGRGSRPIPVEVVDEVSVAVAHRAERAQNSATSTRACNENLMSHGQQLEIFCAAFYTGTPTRFRLCSN